MSIPTERDNLGAQLVDIPGNALVSTELNGLANNAQVLSSVINGNGSFSNTASDGGNYSGAGGVSGAGAPDVRLHLHLAPNGQALAVNSSIDGWFLCAADGATYESGSAAITPPRAPDFQFPVGGYNLTSLALDLEILAVGFPICGSIKTLIRNNGLGFALAPSGNYIKGYPQYPTLPSI